MIANLNATVQTVMNRDTASSSETSGAEIVVEKNRSGQPHKGKVLVAIHAHVDDVPFFAGGLCAKLIGEGYAGYLVRTTNDEKSGGHSIAGNILSNEQDHSRMAAAIGFKDVFDLYYRNRRMNNISSVELRGRLVLILRLLKADTVISFNPVGDDDSDHRVTGCVVDDACCACSSGADFQEHIEAGFNPYAVGERYYLYVKPGQSFNRVVDIGSYVDKKIDAIVECKSHGGGDGAELRTRLAGEGKRLPLLGDSDRSANREYVRQFLLDRDREFGNSHHLQYAERFFYITEQSPAKSKIDEYVEQNVVKI
jgi:LmbE family N-acetylglucosaminyl deacetylase